MENEAHLISLRSCSRNRKILHRLNIFVCVPTGLEGSDSFAGTERLDGSSNGLLRVKIIRVMPGLWHSVVMKVIGKGARGMHYVHQCVWFIPMEAI